MTPEDAIRKAFWSVKIPTLVVLLGPNLIFVFLSRAGYFPSVGLEGLKWFAPAIIFGFVGGWLVWSIQVPKWRLSVYREVDNIVELKQLAVAHQIIWPDGHFFERTEIMSDATRAEIKKLERTKTKRDKSA